MSLLAAPAETHRRIWSVGICVALLILFGCLSYSAVVTKSATYDETEHSISGYVIRNYSDYRIDPQDPALFTWFSSLPHHVGALKFNVDDPFFKNVLAQHDLEWVVSINTLYRTPGNDPDDYLNRSRFLFMLVGVAVGGMICWWAWGIGGRLCAIAATAAFALDPNFIGHASLVKNDVALTLVMVGLMCAVWRFGRRGTIWNLAGIVLALSAGMNIKCSSPLLFVIVFAALLARSFMPNAWPMLRWELKSLWTRLIPPVAVCLIAGVISFISIWACYGFRYNPTPDPSLHFDFNALVDRCRLNLAKLQAVSSGATGMTQADIDKIPPPMAASVTRWMMGYHLLPEAWLDGFFFTYATTLVRSSYLNGNFSVTGWWYFFPLCVLYKTPTAVLVMIPLGGIAWLILRLRQWTGCTPAPPDAFWNAPGRGWTMVCLLMAVLIYGGTAMFSHFNLGIRHVLPLLPFLHITVGMMAARMLARWRKLGGLLVGGMAAALAIESCAAWPNYIAFFNVPSGGSRGGLTKLSDSNLDWGQDLKLLADWHQRHPEKALYLCYFGMADPDYYHIDRLELPGGYALSPQVDRLPQQAGIIAMSATNLQGTYMPDSLRAAYKNLQSVEPREVLGGTIYLYDWPLRPPVTQH